MSTHLIRSKSCPNIVCHSPTRHTESPAPDDNASASPSGAGEKRSAAAVAQSILENAHSYQERRAELAIRQSEAEADLAIAREKASELEKQNITSPLSEEELMSFGRTYLSVETVVATRKLISENHEMREGAGGIKAKLAALSAKLQKKSQ